MPASANPKPSGDRNFLSPSHYDDDASSIHSDRSERSEQDTDSEDDEIANRPSGEIRAHDRGVLLDEEETNRLLEEARKRKKRSNSASKLAKPLKNLFARSYTQLPGTDGLDLDEERERRTRKREMRQKRRVDKKTKLMKEARDGEDGGLMYEMEEGGMKDGPSTGSSSETEGSDEIDRRGMQRLLEAKRSNRQRWWGVCFVYLLMLVGFMILVLVAWKLSLGRKVKPMKGQTHFNNGTAIFAPTTILISLDGFRADFINRGLTPRLNAFIEEGVSPVYMLPSFPSVTFPNHYTLVTGLYPESHGVVGNTFWDPELQEEFYYTDPSRSMQWKWWGGEPLWVTAEKQGIRTAIHMWPGSEANIMDMEPSFIDVYNGKEKLSSKVDRILELLDMPGQEDVKADVSEMRPQLIAAYVPNVDAAGHLYGPNSTEIQQTISDVDTMLDQIFEGLEQRNLTDVVNVVVVSDHGMATTDVQRMIQLDDLIDMSKIEHLDGWPLLGLRPKNPDDLRSLYDQLAKKAETNPNIEVYLRDENMPERYHFSNNQRIAPLWIVPKTGWAVVTKEEFDIEKAKKNGEAYHPRGLHGYDHEHPLMRAIFVARGPAFPHAPNSRVEVFQNIEVYNIICDTLHLTPQPNNGTLRLPLSPIGTHNPSTTPPTPEDPVPPNLSTSPPPAKPPAPVVPPSETVQDTEADADLISISPIEVSSAADPNNRPPSFVGVDKPENDAADTDRPMVGDETTGEEVEEIAEKNFWDTLKAKMDALKAWLAKIAAGEEPDVSEDGA